MHVLYTDYRYYSFFFNFFNFVFFFYHSSPLITHLQISSRYFSANDRRLFNRFLAQFERIYVLLLYYNFTALLLFLPVNRANDRAHQRFVVNWSVQQSHYQLAATKVPNDTYPLWWSVIVSLLSFRALINARSWS